MKRRRLAMRVRVWCAPLALVMTASMVLSTAQVVSASASLSVQPAPAPAPAVKNVTAVKPHFAKTPAQPAAFAATKTTWPAAGSASLRLVAPRPGTARVTRSTANKAPVWAEALAPAPGKTYAGPGTVQIKVLDHAVATAAGIDGVLLSASGDQAGRVRLGLNYGSFAQAYGGNYGFRLRLMLYPACVLTTPKVAACRRPTPLTSTNNAATSTVSAKVAVPAATSNTTAAVTTATVLAAATTSSGGEEGGAAGSYAATTLKPSGSWSAGGSAGDFNYAYPISVPQAPSSLVPQLGLAYDSAAADGRTSATQAQASWLGEGWDTPQAYVEQSFQSCSESPEGSAAPTATHDQCYDGPIFTLSLNGTTTSLVWDSTKAVFESEHADGAVVTHYCTKTADVTCTSGTGNASDSYDQDWWQVVERDGTTYSFGMNHLPGWASGKTATNSVATEPVYSAHSNDPCYKSAGMSSSWCTMTYRWGLDYVVDVHSNAMSYYYQPDTNYYGKYNGASNVSYIRDMYVAHIDYGFTDGNAYGTVPDKVVFNTTQRCVSTGCGPLNSTNAANWPDVPFDLVCASGATCNSQSPSYFSTVRLTGIVAEQYSVSSGVYSTVDTYAMTQTIPATGDGTAATLWLSSIVHTGSDVGGGGSTTAIALPPVTFSPVQKQNRVDTVTDGLPAFYKYRIGTITTETGSMISVSYGLPNPCTAPVTLTASSNTSSCFPVSWTPYGYTAPITDWFNKWAVAKVVQTDPTGGAAAVSTSYVYNGGAAWHYDENELVKAKYRTYGQFRGYGDVVTYLGDGVNDRQSKSETTYFRGMSKDNNSTVVDVTDSQGGLHEDIDQLAGEALENSALLGDSVASSTITSYWVSTAAASRSRTGLPALTSNWVAPVETFTRQAVTSSGLTTWRYKTTDNSYVSDPANANFGLESYEYTHTVPVNAAYDSCTSTTYAAANASKNLVGLVASAETDSVACGGYTAGSKPSAPGSINTLTAPSSVSRPSQVVSAVRTFYDDTNFSTTFPQSTAPSHGDPTMVREAADYTSGAFVWQTTSRTKYDSIGRTTDAYDGNGNDTVTAYTANAVGLTVGQTVTNALNQATSSTIDPSRGLTLTATDLNSVVATSQYDTLGRVSSVWLDSRATSLPANYTYTYLISNSGPTATITNKLNDESGYQTSTVIYDGLLRPRQTQAMTPQSGRLVSDTFYDSRGWTSAKYTGWWDSATTPNTTLVSAADLHDQVPMENFYTYNSLGDAVIDQNEKNGVEISRTYKIDNGDRKTTYPPSGGPVTTTITDQLGRPSEVDSYLTLPTLTAPSDVFTGTFKVSGGTTEVLTYGYDGHTQQNIITEGSGGPVWTKTYNLLGQVTAQTDPDAGTSTGMTHDGAGNLLQATDARGKTVSYTYDALNRKTGRFASTVSGQQVGASGNQIAAWVYDNANAVSGVTHAIGKLTTATSYSGGYAYPSQQLNFNVFGESLGTTVTIPSDLSSAGALAGTYTVRHSYTATTGLPLKDGYTTAQNGLPAETVLYGYQGVMDLPDHIGGLTGYAQSTTYDAYGRVNQVALGASPALAYTTNTYDTNSGRLTNQLVTRATGSPSYVDDQAYTYDLAGNLTTQTDTRLGSAATSEIQCFRYDGLDQLVAAWTANDTCATTPGSTNSSMVADNLGVGSAYWTTWAIDTLGDRTQQVQHAFTGGPSADTTTTYKYGNSAAQPHTLTSTTVTGASAGATSYAYDPAGDMVSRSAGQGNQTLTYDNAGRLTAITGSTTGSSSVVYDADGAVLLQKDPSTITLYLGSQQFVLNTSTNAVTGTRYYSLPGGGEAIRTGTATTAVTFALPDPHNSPSLYLDYTAQNPTWRQFTPYGGTRGTAVTAPDNRGFLNAPADTATGLTIVGAREYDPAVGRFITADPILEATDCTQINGYGYAGNNPVVHADPSGLAVDTGNGSGNGIRFNPENGKCLANCNTTEGRVASNGLSDAVAHRNGSSSSYSSSTCRGSRCATFHHSSCGDEFTCAVINSDYYEQLQKFADNWGGGAIGWQIVYSDPFILGKAWLLVYMDLKKHDPQAVKYLQSPQQMILGLAHDDVAEGMGGAGFNVDGMMLYAMIGGVGGSAEEAEIGSPGCGPGANSFAPDTRVLMADGSSKAIVKVKIGDTVAATDPADGKVASKHVTQLFDNLDTDMADVTVADDHDTQTVIRTTQNHPFWDATTSQWTRAANLHLGDHLKSTNTTTTVVVVGVRAVTQTNHRYNLTVADLHTYYVMAGNTPVLVHNEDGGMVGANGTQITSSTVWLRGSYRIDVENPNPGVRPGQMHFQDQATGAKYLYNHDTGQFEGMPNSLQKELDKKMPDYKKAIVKGNRFLGMGGC